MKVYVVVVTYNGMQWLEQCLNSIPKGYQVVIVDNHSSDETVAFIKQKFSKIHLIEQKENLGFGKANNIGIRYALQQGADYVFLLNQDAYLEENTISKLIQISRENPNYGILSPIHLNGNGTKLDVNFAIYIQQNRELQFDSLKGNIQNKPYNISFVNAAGWFIPKKTFEIVGGFDPIFYHYGEDNNYCQRVLFHKFKIGVVPNTYLKHDREERITKKQSFKDKLILKERFYKSEWANINSPPEKSIKNTKNKLFKIFIKNILKLKFKKAYRIYLERKLIRKIIPEIYSSRFKNKTKGKHYL